MVGDIRAEGAVGVGDSVSMMMECESREREGET
jgi:hypothetical protein